MAKYCINTKIHIATLRIPDLHLQNVALMQPVVLWQLLELESVLLLERQIFWPDSKPLATKVLFAKPLHPRYLQAAIAEKSKTW